MVGKRSVKAAEIRGYIKTRCQLGVSAKEIFNELCVVHGQNEVSYATVTRWIKKFRSGCDSINDAPKSGRPCSATSNTMVNKVCDVVKSDARLTVHQIASRVDISAASVFRILKRAVYNMASRDILLKIPFRSLEIDFEKGEEHVLKVVNNRIHHGKDPNLIRDETSGNGWLHYAAKYNFKHVATKLLEHGIDVLARNKEQKTALEVAIDKKYDKMSALIARRMTRI
ncbi:protein GVQW3-like, partial [Mercenaria mercenaria]|uniref:protein GVQW3-like n=1 Tax=Mercenaria mercenaria TaxID=6596 RepID=UPI00234E540B